MKKIFRFTRLLTVVGALVFLAGCMAPQTSKKERDPVFYPPPPDPPRIQFLMSISGSLDVEGREVETSLFAAKPVHNRAARTFLKPYGIALYQDTIYIADSLLAKVAVINLRQKTFEWLAGDQGGGKLKKPLNLATDEAGNLYVADVDRKKVLIYDSSGNYSGIVGDGYEMKPVDVAVDARRIYVLDRNKDQILVFNRRNGELVEALGQGQADPMNNLALPTAMTLTERGVFYVANVGTGSIVSLDRDGNFLSRLGKMGDGMGQFSRPRGVALDSSKRLFVVDAGHQNVQIFDDEFRLLMHFGDPGVEGFLNVPAGIAVSNENLDFYQQYAAPGFVLEEVMLVVSQIPPYHLNIYGLGKKAGFDYEGYYEKTEELRQREKGGSDKQEQK